MLLWQFNISMNTKQDYHDTPINCLIVLKNTINTSLQLYYNIMYLYSLTKLVSFRFGKPQRQQNESDTAGRAITRMFPYYILYFMTCLCVCLWRDACLLFCLLCTCMFVQECISACLCLCVCGYAEWLDRLFPCCSVQRLWLASLSRTETSASICVAASRPYWWAATSYDKSAVCHSTPPVGELRARQEACKEVWVPPEKRERETNFFIIQIPRQVNLEIIN